MDYKALFLEALQIFNEEMETQYSLENINLVFFTGSSREDVSKKLIADGCMAEDDSIPVYSTGATIVHGNHATILLKTDTNDGNVDAMHVCLHELSHLFCIQNELDGRNFYQEYCNHGDHSIDLGYEIWKEFAADLISGGRIEEEYGSSLDELAAYLAFLDRAVKKQDGNSMKALSLFLVTIMLTKEASDYPNSEKLMHILEDKNIPMANMVKLIHAHCLKVDPLWKIDDDFIHSIGDEYIADSGITERRFRLDGAPFRFNGALLIQ